MECWITKIPDWVWWDIGLVIVTGIITWFAEHFRLSGKLKDLVELKAVSDKNFDEFKAKYVIDDLVMMEDWLAQFVENQRPDGKFDYEKWRDVEKHFSMQLLMEKHSDWITAEPEGVSEGDRPEYIRSECVDSLNLLTKHGYKKALKIRKKSHKKP